METEQYEELMKESYGDVPMIPPNAVALRPVRFLPSDNVRLYTATTFPRDPYAGCELYYRRCLAFGHVTMDQSQAAGICDVLDADGSIVADFYLTRGGLNYLYRALGCRVEQAEE